MQTKSAITKLLREFKALERAIKEWDSTAFARAKQRITDELPRLPNFFAEEMPTIDADWSNIQQTLQSPDYASKIHETFQNESIRFMGEFPNFEIPPFRLEITINTGQAILKYGRKSERKSCLEPGALAQWVKQRYDRIINSPFNASQFAKEMAIAYEKVNRLAFRSPEARWGQPVPLIDVYEILTIRAASRKELPKEVFLFSLTRLIENGLDYEQMRFEFGFSRNARRMFELINRNGRRDRYSTLTIHKL
jgi:hypothetical protein